MEKDKQGRTHERRQDARRQKQRNTSNKLIKEGRTLEKEDWKKDEKEQRE